MKKLLFTTILLTSFNTYSQCSLSYNFTKRSKMDPEVLEILESKGYSIPETRKGLKKAPFSVSYRVPYWDFYILGDLVHYSVRLFHDSGFSKRYDVYVNLPSKIHPENLDLKRRAAKATTISEREELLSQIDPSLNNPKLPNFGIISADKLPNCQDIL